MDKSHKPLGQETQKEEPIVSLAQGQEAAVDKDRESSRARIEEVGVLDESTQSLKEDQVEPESESASKSQKSSLYFARGPYEIPEEHKEDLNVKIEEVCVGGYEKIGMFSKKIASLLNGHSVASEGDYKCEATSYSTRTSLIEVGGSKYFVIYNYPGSTSHRKADTNCRKAWGEKALKATEDTWRDTFTERSLIPTNKGENPRVVILPFIPNISLFDLIEKFDPNKFHGDYEYGKQFDNLETRIGLIKDVATSLGELHGKDITWGEVIPANIGRTQDGKILFFDPETPYLEGTPKIEQKGRDLLSWCTSACTAISRSNKSENNETDYKAIIEAIFSAYPDQEVRKFVQDNLCEELKIGKTLKHPIAFGQFKARVKVDSRKQYNQILQAIKEQE